MDDGRMVLPVGILVHHRWLIGVEWPQLWGLHRGSGRAPQGHAIKALSATARELMDSHGWRST